MPTIKIKGLSKSFGKKEVLKQLDLDFREEGIVAVLGPNGSGKTTLIKCILGLVLTNEGTIEVGGAEVGQKWLYKKDIGYLAQIARFPQNLTFRELLSILIDLRSEESREHELIDRFELQPYLDEKLGNLSGGTLQKVNIVTAFMFDPDILFLDEPTAGLDPLSLIAFKKLIREKRASGKLIIITTHILSLVEELADEVVYLLNGKIHYQGTLKTLYDLTESSGIEESIGQLIINSRMERPVNGVLMQHKKILNKAQYV